MPGILILTIGEGNPKDLEATFFTPIEKSIRKGNWARVLLLPSCATVERAEQLKRRLADQPIEIRPLAAEDQENDLDPCFEQYDAVLRGLIEGGASPQDIVADFTRGTKVMSAALVLAATRHGVPRVRYISGPRQGGIVVAGQERVTELNTLLVSAGQQIDRAFEFLVGGQFKAALDLLPETSGWAASLLAGPLRTCSDCLRPLATFYGAWDQLDYKAASAAADAIPTDPMPREAWEALRPTADTVAWVRRLAEAVEASGTPGTRAEHARCLAADLWAHAQRRLAEHRIEDALIRAVRVLDLIAEGRMAQQNVPVPRDGRYKLFDALARTVDPLGTHIQQLARKGIGKSDRRNRSILIHGRRAASAGTDEQQLADYLDELALLLQEDDPSHATARLHASMAIPGPHVGQVRIPEAPRSAPKKPADKARLQRNPA